MSQYTIEEFREMYPEALIMDGGFNECIVGVLERCGQEDIVVYDKTKVIDKHMQDGLTEEEAIEFMNYNQIGAYVGDYTPGFLEPFTIEDGSASLESLEELRRA